MSLRPTVRVLSVAILLAWAVPASASDIGHEVADQVSLTNYQHYLDDLLYTHDGNNRDAKTGVDKGPARDNIVATFESFGLEVEVEPFTYSGTTCYNVIATQLGTVHPDAYYVIGAHYDSVGNPGADDNASGVAGVLEIARILSAYESEYTIKYMAFDAEEYGLIGSDYYVDNHYYDDIRGMISMDMIAWNTGSNRAEMYGFSGCVTIKNALSTAIVEYGQGLTAELFTESYSSSDHGPFQSAGFQACVLIEDNPEDNPCYHTSCDSVDNAGYINYVFATKMIRSAAGYLTDNGHVFRPINCLTGAGCELGTNGDEDCNANGIWDHCDIRCDTSQDVNRNGIPDECEPHETWYVNCANCPGPGSGSEADPFCTIQAAINAAANGMNAVVEIIVADGTYTGTGNKNLDFGGKALTVRSASGDPATCIIDCEGSGRGFYFHRGETVAAVVDGLTIRRAGPDSGGVFCYSSNPTLTNCAISGNATYGILCQASSPLLTNCHIKNNTSNGVYCSSSSNPILNKCTISENVAGSGGGVYCSSSSPILKSCILSKNRTYSGGGMFCRSSNPTLANCIIHGNTATYSGAGLLCCSSSNPTLTNCTISGNVSTFLSGGVYADTSNPTLTNCVLWDNLPQEVYPASGAAIVTYSDVRGGYEGAGNIDADPGFAFADDFHLMPGSPCVDRGNNSPFGGLPSTDIDGNPRSQDGDADGQAVADMGAYEADPAVPIFAVSPARIEFSVPEATLSQESRMLSIRNAGNGVLAWRLDWDARWLGADALQGESAQEIDTVTLTVDASGLTHGTYSTVLWATDTQASCSPRSVEVLLYVTRTSYVPADYPTIQAALNAAIQGDTVVVADGIYTGTGNKDLDFHGKDVSLQSASRNPASCIIDCQGSGQGFYFHSGETATAVVEGFTIRGASARGVYCSCSDPTLVRCIITDNTVAGTAASGGGACFDASRSTLRECIIRGNSANGSSYGQGGGLFSGGSVLTLTNCSISGNSASGGTAWGGGLCWHWSRLTLVNCFVTANTAAGNSGTGGGVYAHGYDAVFTNCTISGNTAGATGGGVYYYSYDSSLYGLQLRNCVLWGDEPQEISQDGASVNLTAGYSDIQGGWTGMGNLNTDPFFVDAANGDFHLASNSPCIDAGDPASDYSLEPEPDGGRVNMGAYGNTAEAESKGWLYILGYQMVEKTRVGRTVWDYRLRARVKNQSASDATAVSLELLHVPSNVTIIDPLVDVGSVAAGATVTSADTFTIRVDRRTLISQLGISWRVTYAIGGATEDRTFAGSLDRETLEPTHLPAEPVPVPKQGTNVDAEDGSAGASPSLRSRTSGGEMD